MRFAISTYTDETAQLFANYWCHKMRYVLDLYLQMGDPMYKFTHADIQSYSEFAGYAVVFAHLSEEAMIGDHSKSFCWSQGVKCVSPKRVLHASTYMRSITLLR